MLLLTLFVHVQSLNAMKKTTIIIPVLNEAKKIRPFLKQLQPFRVRCQIVLIDGGSYDNTAQLSKDLVDTVLVSAKGRARQMNYGSTYANGTILWFLHADTLVPNHAVDEIEKAVEQGVVWGRFDVSISGSHPMLNIIAKMMNLRSRLSGIATGDQGIFVTRSAFQAVNGFAMMALMEDIELSKQLKRLAKPCCLRTKITTSGRRWEQFGVFQTILLMWWLRFNYFCGRNPEVLAELYNGGKFWKP